MNIIICIDAFSKKVLTHHFKIQNDENILIYEHPTILGMVVILDKFFLEKPDITREEFTEDLVFDTRDYSRVFEKIPNRISLKLKQFSRSIFCDYMLARYQAGLPQERSLHQFCEERGIAVDIDISFEALIKCWKRFFIQKDREIFGRFNRVAVLWNESKFNSRKRQAHAFTDSKLDKIIQSYIEENIYLFHLKRDLSQPYRLQLEKSLRSYVYCEIGGRRAKHVAKQFKNTEQNISRQKRSFKLFLQTAPALNLEAQKV